MDLFNLSAKLSLDSKDYDRSLQNASNAADQWATKFAMAAKTVGSAMASVTKGIASVTSAAVKSFSSYQQLEGGIQTLFGTGGKSFDEWSKSFSQSSDSMQDYIDVARKVINGDFGNGAERKDLLAAAGYDPEAVQQMVNNLINGVDVASNISADTISANMQTAEEKYASLERAQAKAMENARNAYKTAGMSANEYMNTAIGFSGALLKSLGGDTATAAEMTQTAISDMADQANKYGKTVEEVSATYTSLARGNYQTLDNLFGGMFAGTKSGLEEMLKYAEDYRASLGETVDYSTDSYADIVSAIHDISVATGVYGTTAEEASTTIEGSTKMMKASWQNMLTSLVTGGEFFDESLAALVESAKSYVHNIMPVITGALRGISALIHDIVPVIASELPGLINELAPEFIDAAITIFTTLADELPAIIDIIVDVLPSVLEKVVNAIVNAAPNIISGLIKVAAVIAKNLPKIFSSVIKGIPKIFSKAFSSVKFSQIFSGWEDGFKNLNWGTLGETIFQGITSVLDLGGKFLLNIFQPAKNQVVKNVSWRDVGTSVMNGLQSVLEGGGQIVSGLGNVISSAAQKINWDEVGAVIAGCINGVTETAVSLIDTVNWGLIGQTVGDAINGVYTTIDSTLTTISWDTIGQTFGNSVNGVFSTANSLLETVNWELIGKTAGDAINGAYTTVDSALTTISWKTIGETFGNDVNAVFSTANSLLKTVDWELIGKNAGDAINGVSTTISSTLSTIEWETIGQTFGNSVNAVFSTANSALTTTDWELIGKTAGDAVNAPYKTVDSILTSTEWETIGETFANSVNAIFTTANSTLESTDWELIGKNAGDAVNGVSTAINSAINDTNWKLIGKTFSDKINSVFTTVDQFYTTVDWSGIGTTAADAVNNAVGLIQGAIESIDAEGIGSMLGERINGIFENANKFLESQENLKSGFLNFGLGVSEGVEQLGTNAGKKIGGWLGRLFGGDEEETVDSPMIELPEIDEGTLSSYQLLAEAITGINSAISGGEDGEGSGLQSAFETLKTLIESIKTALEALAAYMTGEFIEAIQVLIEALCVITEDEEGNKDAGAGNTLYTALGAIYGLIQDIIAMSMVLTDHWTGAFPAAIETLKIKTGEGIGALQSMANTADRLIGKFVSLTSAIEQALDAFLTFQSYSGKSGSGIGHFVNKFRANGGPVTAGQSYWVGEKGIPELYTPSRSGYITPMKDLIGGRSEQPIIINFNGDVIGDEKSISGYVMKAAKQAIRQEVRAAV